jgi:glycosyltransferase involved in cell wall biosynthesis
VIANGIAVPRPRPDARAWLRRDVLGVGEKAPVVGRVGRAHPQKDLPTFVRAIEVVSRMHPDVHAVLVGEGVDTAVDVTAAVAATGTAHRIHRLGRRDDVADLTAGLDVAVSSSASGESCPLIVLEALAVGVPVVVTDVGDGPSMVAGIGRVVPPRSAARLGAEVADLLGLTSEERQQVGARGRERVASDYDLASMTDRYLEVYRRVARG